MTPEAADRRRVSSPLLVVTALAWMALGTVHLVSMEHPHVASTSMGANTSQGAMGMGPSSWHDLTTSLPASLGLVALMTVAMMTPLVVPPLRHVLARSLPQRRRRHALLLGAAHAAIWLVGGVVLLGLSFVLRAWLGPVVAVAVALVLAVGWQCSPVKQHCLNLHHAHPALAAFGRAADGDALRFGTSHALWCLGSCWALMLLPLLITSGHLVVMLLASAWMWAEALDRAHPPAWRVRLPVTALRIVAHTARAEYASR